MVSSSPSPLNEANTTHEKTPLTTNLPITIQFFGESFRHLVDNDVVKFSCDLMRNEISISLNDEIFGVAFTSEHVNALRSNNESEFLFPAISLNSNGDFATFNSDCIVPNLELYWLLDLQKSLASTAGKMCARMIGGPSMSVKEVAYENWLRSPMIVGGLESNDEISDNFVLDVARRTSVGMSLLVESQFEQYDEPPTLFTPPRSTRNGNSGHSNIASNKNSKVRGLQLIEQKTTHLIKDWILPIEYDEYDEINDPSNSTISSPISKREAISLHQQPLHPMADDDDNNDSELISDGGKLIVDLFVRDKILNSIAENETRPYNFMGTTMLTWLEETIKEQPFFKKILSRKNSYEFPRCEMPFIAALLKHTGLWREIVWLLDKNSSSTNRAPSPNMLRLFFNVKQLRAFLRQKKQEKIVASEGEGENSKYAGMTAFNTMCDLISERAEFLRGTKVNLTPSKGAVGEEPESAKIDRSSSTNDDDDEGEGGDTGNSGR